MTSHAECPADAMRLDAIERAGGMADRLDDERAGIELLAPVLRRQIGERMVVGVREGAHQCADVVPENIRAQESHVADGKFGRLAHVGKIDAEMAYMFELRDLFATEAGAVHHLRVVLETD